MRQIVRNSLIALLLLVPLGFAMAASQDGGSAERREVDGAFITGMVAHHDDAVAMAEMARERTKRRQVKRLAEEIVSAQTREIDELNASHRRLFSEPVPAGGMRHGDLGLSEREMAVGMDMSRLESTADVDMAFIDAMITHRQGAIRMARAEIERGEDPQLKALARRIVADQSLEIAQLSRWHASWYGSPSPSGGVPPVDDAG